MKLAKSVLSLFEEKIESLDGKHIKEIQSELGEYSKDWPEEVFTVVPDGMIEWSNDGEDSTNNVKDADVSIADVSELFKLLQDTLDFEIDYKNVKDQEIEQIFDSLKNKEFTVKTQITSSHKGKEQKEECSVEFKIVDCKYNKNKNKIEVKVKDVSLV